MNTAGDAADQIVRESIQITDATVRLAGVGARNLAALLLALSKDQQKIKGKTSLQRLLKDGRELKVCRLKTSDLKEFHKEAKRYGVLYTPIIDKQSENGLCDLMVRADDIAKINHILDRMGYLLEKQSPDNEKKNAPSKSSLSKQGHTSMHSPTATSTERPSVKSRINAVKTMNALDTPVTGKRKELSR